MNRRPGAARREAERRGRLAEQFAAIWCALNGYRIVARRFRAPSGEIDLVVRRGRLIAIVEVKIRSSLDEAAFAVDARNRRRIEAAARSFLARRQKYADAMVRYDVFAVSGWRFRWIKQAWREQA